MCRVVCVYIFCGGRRGKEEGIYLQIRIHAINKQQSHTQNKNQQEHGKDLDHGQQDGNISHRLEQLVPGRHERRDLLERCIDLARVGDAHLCLGFVVLLEVAWGKGW